jgi:transposase-like protein
MEFMLSPKRDLIAAKLFLRLALCATNGIRPRVINVDGHPALRQRRRGMEANSADGVAAEHHLT